jgi:hypothetical protein
MSNQKIRLWSAAGVVALGFALVVGQGISGVAVQPAYAGDYCPTPTPTPTPTKPPHPENGNNGWGNGGEDGTNPGSDFGGGVSQGGQGDGSSQSDTKSADEAR